MRQPGIEPGSTAWKAAMLTTIPLTLVIFKGWVSFSDEKKESKSTTQMAVNCMYFVNQT